MSDHFGTFTPGEVITSVWNPAPATGSTALADVTARTCDPNGTITSLAGITGSDPYTIIYTVADTAAPGEWTLRWESNSPSAKLVKELRYTVTASPFGASA